MTADQNASRIRVDWRPLHALVFIAATIGALCIPALRIWPLAMLVPLVAYLAVVAALPPLRETFPGWRFGCVSRPAAVATLVISAGSCLTLVAFHVFTRPDVSFLSGSLPVTTLGGVIAVGAVFSLLNAFLEEAIFRAIFFDAIGARWGAWPAIVITSAVFGYFHMHGYPPGPLGAVLAGIYGVCLGWLRSFTGGIGWPVVAHITADATIFILLARSGAL